MASTGIIIMKKTFLRGFDPSSLSAHFRKYLSVVLHGPNFREKAFVMEIMPFDAVFRAHFEYHVSFVSKWCFNDQIIRIRGRF
jgi:hypothetical protein